MALRAEQVGDVQRKGPVAAPVSPGQTAIHLHRAGVVHSPEVEQDAPFLARRGREGAVVVEPLAGLQRPAHAGGFHLGRIGYEDSAVPLCRELRALGDGVVPRAVQVDVAVPTHTRAGIFGERMHFSTSLNKYIRFGSPFRRVGERQRD